MSAGLDATLIGPLEFIQADSTDHLCLSGFNHSVVVVSWLPTEQVREHFQRLALGGSVRRLGEGDSLGPAALQAAPSGKRVYHLLLTSQSKISEVTAQLRNLLQDRNVKTVGISLPGGSSARKPLGVPTAPTSGAGSQAARGNHEFKQESKAAAARPAVEPRTPPAAHPRPSSGAYSSDSDDEWLELDQLVDDFDALDL